jgi:outer membrane protein OmpA-like peptidoglycan-associated protein
MKKLLVVILTLFAVSCATKKFVNEEMQKMNQDVSQRVDNVSKDVEEAQEEIQTLHARDAEIEKQLAALSDTSREAMDRALDAQKLAEGKFLYEITLSDDKVHFGSSRWKLSEEAKAALDAFAQMLKAQNKNVYVEIQGHTDDRGEEDFNYTLGLKRAQAVKEYLNKEHGLPLHRMEVISYGETKPAILNLDAATRAQNRRVVIVVME